MLEIRAVVEVLEKVEYLFGYAQVLERHLAEYSVIHCPLVPVVLPHHRRVVWPQLLDVTAVDPHIREDVFPLELQIVLLTVSINDLLEKTEDTSA